MAPGAPNPMARRKLTRLPCEIWSQAAKRSRKPRHDLGPESLDRLHQDRMWNEAVVGVTKYPVDRLSLHVRLDAADHAVDGAGQDVAFFDRVLRRQVAAGFR